MTLLRNLINLIFTETCFSCNQRIQANEKYLCQECELKLDFITDICPKCGAELSDTECRYCREGNYVFTKARSLFQFNKQIQALIHNLKYNEISGVAKYLTEKTVTYLKEFQPFGEIDFICPVPLHKVKKRERGYNQAELISKNLASQLNWEHASDLITRIRYTNTQTSLSKEKRCENVKNAFRINKKYEMKDKNILIIDDVFTTGATINSISNLLKHNQIGKIYVLTIARA